MNHKEYIEGLAYKLKLGIVHKPVCEKAADALRVMLKLIDEIEGLADYYDGYDERRFMSQEKINEAAKALRVMLKLIEEHEDEIRSRNDTWNEAQAALDDLVKDNEK